MSITVAKFNATSVCMNQFFINCLMHDTDIKIDWISKLEFQIEKLLFTSLLPDENIDIYRLWKSKCYIIPIIHNYNSL